MKYRDTCAQGSFSVWGTGFRFEYEAAEKVLNIIPSGESKAVAYYKLDNELAKSPYDFVRHLDKTNQIKALMYSNNRTTNLADTIDMQRIASLLKTTTLISGFVQSLHSADYERFSEDFSDKFELKAVNIRSYISNEEQREIFYGELLSLYGNIITARSKSLSGLLQMLSERVLTDLIMVECGHNLNNTGHNLLNASSKLATISRVLDKNFIPKRRIERFKGLKNSLTPTKMAGEFEN